MCVCSYCVRCALLTHSPSSPTLLVLAPVPPPHAQLGTPNAADTSDEYTAALITSCTGAFELLPPPRGPTVNGFPAYRRVGSGVPVGGPNRSGAGEAGSPEPDHGRALWHAGGTWLLGRMEHLGRRRGLLVATSTATSPERIASVWRVANASGGWVAAPRVRCLAGAAASAAFERQRAARMATLRSGAVSVYLVSNASGSALERVRRDFGGEYRADGYADALVNGRRAYRRVGDAQLAVGNARMLWYSTAGGGWFAGRRMHLGQPLGALMVRDHSALLPEAIRSVWSVAKQPENGEPLRWEQAADVRCLAGEPGRAALQRFQLAAEQATRASAGRAGRAMKRRRRARGASKAASTRSGTTGGGRGGGRRRPR